MSFTSENETQIEYLDMSEICDDANKNCKQFYYDTTKTTETETPGTSGIQTCEKAQTNNKSRNDRSKSPTKRCESNSYNLLQENNAILKEALKELKYLRQEQKTLRREVQDLKSLQNFSTSPSVPKILLNLPRPTTALFLELEEEVKKEENERALMSKC